MTGPERLRALLDRLYKAQASRPPMPSGGSNRMMEEAVNTGANARGLASLSTKKPKQPGAIEPLAALIQKARK